MPVAEGEDQRHERVLEDRAGHAVLPVAPVGDEHRIPHDAEPAAPRDASYELYVVELEAGVEPAAPPEEVVPDGQADARPGGEDSLERLVARLKTSWKRSTAGVDSCGL